MMSMPPSIAISMRSVGEKSAGHYNHCKDRAPPIRLEALIIKGIY